MRRIALAFLLACLFVAPSRANPVPDSMAQEFRALVRETASSGTCPDVTLLADYFGRFGLDLLMPDEVASIEKRFDVFAPLLVSAQRPTHQLSYQIQRLYRANAGAGQRDEMVSALRAWLTVPLPAAPWSMVAGPAAGVRAEIQRARVTAAEMLSTWNDRDSDATMKALAAPDTFSADMAWHLQRARECLANPRARTFLVALSDGSIDWCKRAGDVSSLTLYRGNLMYPGKNGRALSPDEGAELWKMITESKLGEDSRGIGGSGFAVLLEFKDGVRACLDPVHQTGHVVYTDNTSLDWRQRTILENPQLNAWLLALTQSDPALRQR